MQKILARNGCGSRREIERLISDGKVKLNGRVAALGNRALFGDTISVFGREIEVRRADAGRVIALHKPCGFVVSRKPQRDQRSVFELLPETFGTEWICVGRLDINTSGLLLLTNDGDLAHHLMHPASGVSRVYLVRVWGRVTQAMTATLLSGVDLGGRAARFDTIEAMRKGSGNNQWFRVALREGRNREVRRLWASQGLTVSRLARVQYGSQNLDRLSAGRWRELTRDETRTLYREAYQDELESSNMLKTRYSNRMPA